MDTFSNGIQSIVSVLRPKGSGWIEIPAGPQYSLGNPCRAFMHKRSNIFVMSAVEAPERDRGPEYHLSISHPVSPGVVGRVDSNAAKWVLEQFGMDGAEEDNHVPGGKVRNFWRPVAAKLIGLECECKDEEPAIVEDKGDFVWRGITR